MTIKLELAAVALTVLGAAGFLAFAQPLKEPAPAERQSGFIEADYAAFDRGFRHGYETCAVGIEKNRLCFQPSPLETRLVVGEAIPEQVPLLPAEFPIIAATSVKTEGQKLVRFGRSLALVDRETRIVQDVIRLNEPSFAEAIRPRPQDIAYGDTQGEGA